jgi:hypothetical protein
VRCLMGRVLVALIAIAPVIVSAQPPLDVRITDVTQDANQKAAILQALQSHVGGQIMNCALMITYTQQVRSGRDSSYGAVCTVRLMGLPAQTHEMCDDWLVGKFTDVPVGVGEVPDQWVLARFIEQHCTPGG